MKNKYKMLADILSQSNSDMLIERPTLFHYVKDSDFFDVNQTLNIPSNGLLVFMKRLPDNIKRHFGLTDHSVLVRLPISRLKKVGEQNVDIRPNELLSIKFRKSRLSFQDIELLTNDMYANYNNLVSADENTYPCARLFCSNNSIPRFAYNIKRR